MRRHLLTWAHLVVLAISVPAIARPIKFADAQTFPSPMTQPSHVAVGDFNSDGFPDLAVGNNFNNVAIFLGNGDGTFVNSKNYKLRFYVTGYIAAADFNGDGKIDLAIVGGDATGHGLVLLMGKGDGTFKSPRYFPMTFSGSSIFPAVGDFNNDHHLDLYAGGNGNGTVLLGDGKGAFLEGEFEPASGFSVAVGDFNHDGNLDVATTQPFGTPSVAVVLGNGDGTFQPPHLYTQFFEPAGITVGDFNGDHNLDLAVGDINGFSISILLGKGDGTFTSSTSVSISDPATVATADFNGDGTLDLAASSFAAGSVVAWQGDGKGGFAKPFTAPTGTQPVDLKVADFNRDGAPDVVVVNHGADSVSVLLNTAGTFIQLVSSANPVKAGAAVTFTVQVQGSLVTSPAPTGEVLFQDGDKTLGRVKLSGGKASFTTSALAAGSHSITGVYQGNAKFNPHQSEVLVQAVN